MHDLDGEEFEGGDELDGEYPGDGARAEGEFYHPDPGHWSNRLRSKPTPNKSPFASNPIRWGDSRQQDIIIPAASILPVLDNFVQVVDIRESSRPRTWCLSLALTWLNPGAGTAPEQLGATFIIEFGVGSAKQTMFQNLLVNTALTTTNVIVPALPADSIVIAVQTGIPLPVAGAARTYLALASAMVAPIMR